MRSARGDRPLGEGAATERDLPGTVLSRAASALVPLSTTIELTHRCDLACVHCYVKHGASKPPDAGQVELSPAEWMRVLDEAADLGTLYLTVTGGEPLLREDLFDILAGARQRHFAVRLFTNATRVDGRVAERLAKAGLTSVEVSLYSAEEDAHDAITGVGGSHGRTVAAIGELLTRGVKVVCKVPLMDSNVDGLEDLLGFADRLGVPLRVDPMLSPTDECGLEPLRRRIGAEGLAGVVDVLARRGVSVAPVERSDADPLCGAGRTHLSVGPHGEVKPCIGYPLIVGHAIEESLETIWRESPALTRLRELTMASREDCLDCGARGFCRLCPGTAFLEAGSDTAVVRYACLVAGVCRDRHLRVSGADS